jgi:hypothetical protein
MMKLSRSSLRSQSPSFPRALLSKAPEHFFSIRGVLLRGASHEHVSVMGVALCRAGGNPSLTSIGVFTT